jgi:hypothetical protein
MHGELGGDLLVDAGQEAFELHCAVARGQLGDDVARRHVQRCVQVGGPMPGVVVAASLRHTGQ